MNNIKNEFMLVISMHVAYYACYVAMLSGWAAINGGKKRKELIILSFIFFMLSFMLLHVTNKEAYFLKKILIDSLPSGNDPSFLEILIALWTQSQLSIISMLCPFSDHCTVCIVSRAESQHASITYWRLDKDLLRDVQFMSIIKIFWRDWWTGKKDYDRLLYWWD